MNTVRLEIDVDISDADEELDRLRRGPATADILRFEAVLARQFAVTQMAVSSPAAPHTPTYRPTGKLQASGEPNSWVDEYEWHGEISYGGGDVDYAMFELFRGGHHDFMDPARDFDRHYTDAIIRFLANDEEIG